MTDKHPAEAIKHDETRERAPNPRRHYSSPEELLEDIDLDHAQRESLLTEWKDEVDAQLAAESEGMSASDPIRAEAEARLAAEARRVSDALTAVREITSAA